MLTRRESGVVDLCLDSLFHHVFVLRSITLGADQGSGTGWAKECGGHDGLPFKDDGAAWLP